MFKSRSLTALSLMILSGILLSGCVDIPKIPGAEKIPGLEWLGETKKSPELQAAEEEGGIETEGGEAEEGGGDEETNESALLPPEMRNLPFEEVEVPASDKVMLYGRLYDPSQKGDEEETAAEPENITKYPLVILVHGLNRNNLAWAAMPAHLVKAGYAVFSVDLRGHGRSTKNARKKPVAWRLFQSADWQKLPNDVVSVLRYFKASEDYPQVDGSRAALFGEGIGANAVMMAAGKDPAAKALVLMSPGMNYKGLTPSHDYVDYKQAALIMASQQDEYSYDSAQKLYRWFVGPRKLELYQQNIGIGADILVHQPELQKSIVDWLETQLPPTPVTVPNTEAASEDAG